MVGERADPRADWRLLSEVEVHLRDGHRGRALDESDDAGGETREDERQQRVRHAVGAFRLEFRCFGLRWVALRVAIALAERIRWEQMVIKVYTRTVQPDDQVADWMGGGAGSGLFYL